MARLLCIAAVMAGDLAFAARTFPRHLPKMGHASLATVPMRTFKEDCKLQRPIAALVQFPGAGMDPTPGAYSTVLKDGYFHVDCVKDYMFLHGDKHGDNRYEYQLGDISNVSIVHYSAAVGKEDRVPMSHDTCFAFCRTVPEMLYFGITNGRECYCAPYFKPMASDSSECDAVCEGQTTLMCGGKTKSSIFEMHACQNTAANLADASAKMGDVDTQIAGLIKYFFGVYDSMQTVGDELKKVFGEAGDPAAAGLMQSAVNFAGKLEVAEKKAMDLRNQVTDLATKEAALSGNSFEDVTAVADAEDLIAQMEKVTAELEAATEELQTLSAQASATSNTTGALDQYYEGMYFVDGNKTSLPSTCGGDLAAPPMLATAEECAAACDAVRLGQSYGGSFLQLDKRVGGCVGFSIFKTSTPQDLCFLFSKLTSLTYYSQCAANPAFVQKSKELPQGTACMAKLQYFESTPLAPDASGKCEKCLKKVTHAERCPSHLPPKF